MLTLKNVRYIIAVTPIVKVGNDKMNFVENLRKGSTICFFGDSITEAGLWESEIFSFFAENYSEKLIKIYNCGSGGDSVTAALDRVYGDCLAFSPSYVSVMFGMNDVGREYYASDDAENLKMRDAAFEKYKKNMTSLVKIIASSGAELILCTPTRYDDFDKTSDVPIDSVNDGLARCAEFVRELAEKYNCILVDFHKEMLQFTNLPKRIINDDRVHPNAYGNHLMAQVFLKTLGLIDKIDYNEYTEKNENNNRRRLVESICIHIRLAENFMRWGKFDKNTHTVEERKNWLKNYDTMGQVWRDNVIKEYLKYADYKDMYIAELVKLTNLMYGNS